MTATTFSNDTFNLLNIQYQQYEPTTTSAATHCVLPSLHHHAISKYQVTTGQWLWQPLLQDQSDDGDDDEKQARNQTDNMNGNRREGDVQRLTVEQSIAASRTVESDQRQRERGAKQQQQQKFQQLDPYIDAVQVKSRIDNKRGPRVGAASNSDKQLAARQSGGGGGGGKVDYEPNSSYYSKTVHIEESGDSKKDWDYWSDDQDSDSDDDGGSDDGHELDGHSGGGKYGLVGGKHHQYHQHGGKYVKKNYKHKKGRKRGKKKRRRKKHKKAHHKHHKHQKHHYDGKKVIYIKLKEPGKYHEHEYHHHKHDADYGGHKDHHYKDYDGDKYHYKHYGYKYEHDKHKHDKHHHHYDGQYYHGKQLVKGLNLTSKSKLSLAGLLGQTLLCVNYLLILKQPTYDKYHSHYNYYTKYAPNGGHGDTVELKSAGPIILAHCGVLPEQRALQVLTSPTGRHKSFDAATSLVSAASESLPDASRVGNSSASSVHPAGSWHESDASPSSSTRRFNLTTSTKAKLEIAEQQARLVYMRDSDRLGRFSPAAVSPPTYYYTLGATSSSGQPLPLSNSMASDSGTGSGLFTPIQTYLNRLLFTQEEQTPTTRSMAGGGDDDDDAAFGPLQVLGMAPRRRQPLEPNRGATQMPLNARGRSGAVLTRGAGRVILVDGQPQVVEVRDNLAEMRTKPVEIRMRVISGRHLLGLPPQRAVRLTLDAIGAGNGNSEQAGEIKPGLAVLAPDQMLQNDQPAAVDARSGTSDSGNRERAAVAAASLVDLPEYALSGDTIELSCNHRLQASRLYSVKWFKDSVEFYRFEPANNPSKSSLFLPDVQLDLERSNAASLYLRNVSHRTGGQFRCEVISEAPDFELLTGERTLQVFTLPDTGPKLDLIERDDLLRPPTTTSAALTLSRGRVFSMGPQQVPATGRVRVLNGDDTSDDSGGDGDDDEPATTTSNRNGRGRSQAQRQMTASGGGAAGPIVRCESDRSRPVAQVRFLINNRPVELVRTIENATVSYSDGLESNVASFRVLLDDFVIDEEFARQLSSVAGRANALDRAASLKSPDDQSRIATTTTTSTTTSTTTTTTTTTTSTTKRPALASSDGRQKSGGGQTGKSERLKSGSPNEQVQFDDQAEQDGRQLNPKRKQTTAKRKKENAGGTRKKQAAGKKQEATRLERRPNMGGGGGGNMHSLDETEAEDEDEQLDENQTNARDSVLVRMHDLVADPLPAGQRDKTWAAAKISGGGGQLASSESVHHSSSSSSVLGQRDADKHIVAEADRGPDSEAAARTGGGGQMEEKAERLQARDSEKLNMQEQRQQQQQQRTIIASQVGSPRTTTATSTASGGEPRLYSNFIRIKCVSSVATLGYEMISELNVPLSLLVPASQLGEALRRQSALQSERQLTPPSSTTTNSNRNGDGNSQTEPAARRRNGNGSLQAPRTVSVDRVAQASGQSAASVFYARDEQQQEGRRNRVGLARKANAAKSPPGQGLAVNNMRPSSSGSNSASKCAFWISSEAKYAGQTSQLIVALISVVVGLIMTNAPGLQT